MHIPKRLESTLGIVSYYTCYYLYYSIDAFHTNKLKQILYVVHPGFGQDMPA